MSQLSEEIEMYKEAERKAIQSELDEENDKTNRCLVDIRKRRDEDEKKMEEERDYADRDMLYKNIENMLCEIMEMMYYS